MIMIDVEELRHPLTYIISLLSTIFISFNIQIHTGLQHNLIWAPQPNGLPLNDSTIADELRLQGYATHMVGKWHIGFYKKEYTPLYRGFDSFYGKQNSTGSDFIVFSHNIYMFIHCMLYVTQCLRINLILKKIIILIISK